MKKSILALSLVGLLFSCKKDLEQKTLTPNEIIGTAYLKGNLTKATITPNLPYQPGNMSWNSNGKAPAAGVNITIRVAKSGWRGLYPNSSMQGTDVYSGTTDANGNFNIAVKSNGRDEGVRAEVLVEGFNGTVDTVFNGTTRTGRNANYMGFSRAYNLYAGQTQFFETNTCSNSYPTWEFDCQENIVYYNQNNGPLALNIGAATITGSLNMQIVTSSVTVVSGTATPASLSTSFVPVPAGARVKLRFDSDPVTYSTKIYQTTTDAAGGYTFNVSTVADQTPGFNQNGDITVADWTATRDTIKINSIYTGTVFVSSTTVTVAGKNGTWNASSYGSIGVNGLYNNQIRNAQNFSFTTGYFLAN